MKKAWRTCTRALTEKKKKIHIALEIYARSTCWETRTGGRRRFTRPDLTRPGLKIFQIVRHSTSGCWELCDSIGRNASIDIVEFTVIPYRLCRFSASRDILDRGRNHFYGILRSCVYALVNRTDVCILWINDVKERIWQLNSSSNNCFARCGETMLLITG